MSKLLTGTVGVKIIDTTKDSYKESSQQFSICSHIPSTQRLHQACNSTNLLNAFAVHFGCVIIILRPIEMNGK